MLPDELNEQPLEPKPSWTGPAIALSLVLAIVLIGQYVTQQPGRKALAEKRSAERYLAIKNGNMAVRLELSRFGEAVNKDPAKSTRRIVQSYSKGLPDDGLALRIAVAKSIFGKPGKNQVVIPKGLPDRTVWLEILNSSEIPRNQVDAYAKVVKKARLGPLMSPVMSTIYEKSGDHKRAESILQHAKQQASERSAILAIGFLLVILATVAGVVFLILGFVYIKSLPVISSANLHSNVLAFIRYLLAYFCGSLLAKYTVSVYIKSELSFPVTFLILQLLAFSQLDMSVLRVRFQPAGKWVERIVYGIAGSCAALPVYFLAMYASQILSRNAPPIDSFTKYLNSGGLTTAVMVMVIVLVGPFVEEVAFRGVLLDSLQKKMSFWPAAIVSSIAFSALHGSFEFKLVPIFFFGLILCYLRRKTGSLTSSYVAHMCNNAIVTGLFFLT